MPDYLSRRATLLLGAAWVAGIPTSPSLAQAVGDRRAFALVRDLKTGHLHTSRNLQTINLPRSPGSLIKLLTAQVGLQRQAIRPEESLLCGGGCWHPRGHGSLRLRQALAHSCNVFFYQVGERLGSQVLAAAVAAAGWGEVGLASASLLATGEDPQLQVLPLSLLGWLETLVTDSGSWEREVVRQGMIEAVRQGTCQGLALPGGVAAKTGTIRVHHHYHGWVAAYSPTQQPRWLILVYVPTGRAYQVGIPVAQRVLTWAWDHR
ncbi:MAG: penicillin-binding transpeptidase domain-containing protein [Thermostichales cyanobacterium SZTDM-1c_bins_54]